ncbi:acyl-ACP--UDP-N-acetylglucosamine O-acyltransferase [Candidatus Pelagibacter sp.]|uniref:acyl-ACP--UDP-N-acetylglucosamine O-acyltransferase n=1 Tax=Candidatus Pelagibacter sp. TaxID=2024849 RepID=UPI003F8507B4
MIHQTAIIDSKAKIGNNVEIGPYCVIGPEVQISDNNKLYSHVNISGHTKIGESNTFYPFCSIGNNPQDLKYNGEKTELVIGKNNKIREYVTIHPGTTGGGGKTIIGDNCLFMISSHIAHDCIIGNNVILANNVPIGGHAEIGDHVVIGGNSAVQQFTRIGKMAMIGGMTGVLNDVIPYGLSIGNRNHLQGLNLIGLRRKNISNKDILELSEAYKEIFKTDKLSENLSKLNGSFQNNELVKDVVNFINKDKKRPICSPFSK